jgi:hypothetical protein
MVTKKGIDTEQYKEDTRMSKQEALAEAFKDVCSKCNNTGLVMNYANKGVHICYDCLEKGVFNQTPELKTQGDC